MTGACGICGKPCEYVDGKTSCCSSTTLIATGAGWGGNRRTGPREVLPDWVHARIRCATATKGSLRLYDVYRGAEMSESMFSHARRGMSIPTDCARRLIDFATTLPHNDPCVCEL